MATPSFTGSPSRRTPPSQWNRPPPQLTEETTFLVGDNVVCRVPGRHGWHPVVITSAEMTPAESAFEYIYSVQRQDGEVISGLKAGNLRKHLSASGPNSPTTKNRRQLNVRPSVETFTIERPSTLDTFRPGAATKVSTIASEDLGTATPAQKTVPKVESEESSIASSSVATATIVFENHSGAKTAQLGSLPSTEAMKVATSSLTPSTAQSSVVSASSTPVPAAVRALLRFATSRGVDCSTWFAPEGGWPTEQRATATTSAGSIAGSIASSAKSSDNSAGGGTVTAGLRVVPGAVFREKLTHLGLGLAVGRSMEEQMAIERGLSTDALDQTVKAAALQGGLVDISWLLASSAPAQTAQQVTQTVPTPPSAPPSSFPPRPQTGMRGGSAVGSARVEPVASVTSSGGFSRQSRGLGSACADVLMAPVPSPDPTPLSKKAAQQQTKSTQQRQHWHRNEPCQRQQQQGQQGQQRLRSSPSSTCDEEWAKLESDMEGRLRSLCRHHADTFHALRISLGAQNDENDDEGAPHGRKKVVTRAEVSRALVACRIKWPPLLVDALMHRAATASSTATATTAAAAAITPTSVTPSHASVSSSASSSQSVLGGGGDSLLPPPRSLPSSSSSVPAAALHDYLLSVKLTHSIHWDEWKVQKSTRSSAMHRTLLQGFAAILAGTAPEASPSSPRHSSTSPRQEEAWGELCERFEQLPKMVESALSGILEEEEDDGGENEGALASLLEQEAEAMAREWVESSRDARQDVNDRMVRVIETRRVEAQDSDGAGGGGGGGKIVNEGDMAVSLFQSYQRHVVKWHKLRRQMSAGGVEGGEGGGPPSYNNWLDKFVDPKGEVRRMCQSDAARAHAQGLLESDSAPLVSVPLEVAPKAWKGLGEVSRTTDPPKDEGSDDEGGEGDSSGGGASENGGSSHGDAALALPVVWYRPYSFTKTLLAKFLHGITKPGTGGEKAGFKQWLEARSHKRSETKQVVKQWGRRKGMVAAARSAGGSCSAVLCLDAGGMDAQSGGAVPTLESLLHSLHRYQETNNAHPLGTTTSAAAAATAGAVVATGGSGGSGGGSGSGDYAVNITSRQGVDMSKCLKALTQEPGVTEVAGGRSTLVGQDFGSNRTRLRQGLLTLLRPHQARKDVKKRVPTHLIRLSSNAAAALLPSKRAATSSSSSPLAVMDLEQEHAELLHRALFCGGGKGQYGGGAGSKEQVVEVRVSSGGGLAKWHRARVLRVSPAEHLREVLTSSSAEDEHCAGAAAAGKRRGASGGGAAAATDEGYSDDNYSEEGSVGSPQQGGAGGGEEGGGNDENDENAVALSNQRDADFDTAKPTQKSTKALKVKKKKKKKRASRKPAGATAVLAPPKFYDVAFLKDSREGRLEASVDAILRKCSKMGEQCEEVTESEGRRVRVVFGELDAEAGLSGQHQVLDAIGDKLMEDVEHLKAAEIGWVGPCVTPGTELMPESRRTHAYVVPKSAVDKVLASTFTSVLADKGLGREQVKVARDLLNPSFDFGRNKMCAAQEQAACLAHGVAASTVKVALQHDLTEATHGLFHSDHQRQVSLAQQLAQGRDRGADKAFKEWATTKELAQRKKRAEGKLKAKEEVAAAKAAAAARDAGHKKWCALAARGMYASPGGLLKARGTTKERLTHKAMWSFEPPTPTDDLVG